MYTYSSARLWHVVVGMTEIIFSNAFHPELINNLDVSNDYCFRLPKFSKLTRTKICTLINEVAFLMNNDNYSLSRQTQFRSGLRSNFVCDTAKRYAVVRCSHTKFELDKLHILSRGLILSCSARYRFSDIGQ